MNFKRRLGDYALPTIVLVIICLVVTCALAFTYSKTKTTIDANAVKTHDEAAKEVLGNEEGKALEETVQSYGGEMSVMVGISNEGKITGVKVVSHGDTPGLGTKAMEPEYLKQYKGTEKLEYESIRDDDSKDAITGATISSNAVYEAVKKAILEYEKAGR
ncbi:FMN-binding protein [Candidatus Micrarchaeota archaeon]|nr:FMN-binding protein [Candidatus Micrarchaeota archaeon]